MPVIAVIGASTDRRKFGNKALRAFRSQGYTVVPIHPSAAEVEGERAYRSVLDYPGHVDEATLYVPADAGVQAVVDVAQKGIPTVWLNPGADDPAVVQKARSLNLKVIVACSIIAAGESPLNF